MRFKNFESQFRSLQIFDSSLVVPFYDSAQQAQRQLSDWTRVGKLVQLRRGTYTFPIQKGEKWAHSFRVANYLVRPSYVSLQSVLSYYDLIPDHTESVTSVTTGRPQTLTNSLGHYITRRIKKKFFYGFRFWKITHQHYAFVATPEKAILDLIYLTPDGDNKAYIRTLRLQNLDTIKKDRLCNLVAKAKMPKLNRALKHLLALIEEENTSYIFL